MPATAYLSSLPLRAVLRPVPPLTPEDSISVFLEMARSQPLQSLPVMRRGVLCGMVSSADVLPLLRMETPEERSQALTRPVAEVMRPPVAVASPQMTTQEIGALLAEQGLGLIPVVDSDGACLGVVLASDLLLPDYTTPRPARVGGMATPFGVYLTDGALQAGASNGALMATGAVMALLLFLSREMLEVSLWLGQRYAHLPRLPVFDLDFEPSSGQPGAGLLSIGLQLLTLLIFFVLMRATRLAGYHAAEHQAVHALERNEVLVPNVVRRMPRAHPRCGTNLMAAGLLFYTFCRAFSYVPWLDPYWTGPLFAALGTVFAWRPVGTFLQERFTTRQANEREIASGIAAANALAEAYLHSPPARVRFLRRIWCMGLLQVLCGSLLATSAIAGFSYLLETWIH